MHVLRASRSLHRPTERGRWGGRGQWGGIGAAHLLAAAPPPLAQQWHTTSYYYRLLQDIGGCVAFIFKWRCTIDVDGDVLAALVVVHDAATATSLAAPPSTTTAISNDRQDFSI